MAALVAAGGGEGRIGRSRGRRGERGGRWGGGGSARPSAVWAGASGCWDSPCLLVPHVVGLSGLLCVKPEFHTLRVLTS